MITKMITQETVTLILGILGIGGIVFGIFLFFRKPQEKSETDIAVFGVKLDELDKKFCNLRDNHLHTIEGKIDEHIAAQIKNELLVCEKLAIIQTHLENLLKK